jgi:hypothetical protein
MRQQKATAGAQRTSGLSTMRLAPVIPIAIVRSLRPPLLAALILLALVPLVWLVARGALSGPLWLDEVTYLSYAERWSARQTSAHAPVSLAQGLLFAMFAYPNFLFLYLKAIGLIGVDWISHPEIVLRLPSLLAFAATILVAYRATRRFSRTTALLCALAISCLPLCQFYACEGKAYSFASLFALGYVYAALRLTESYSRRRLAAAGLLGFLASYFNIWSAVLLPSLPLWALRTGCSRAQRSAALWATLPGAAISFVQVYFLAHAFSHQTHLWFSRTHAVHQLWLEMARSLWSGPLFLGPPASDWQIRLGIGWCALALAAQLLTSLRVGVERAFLPFSFVSAIALLLILAGRVPGFVAGRYEVPLAAIGVVALTQLPARIRLALLTGFVVLGLCGAPATALRARHKSNTRDLIEAVRAQGQIEGEAIVTRYARGWDPLHRYTAYFYGQRIAPPWRIIDYPTLEQPGSDFMLLGSVVRSRESIAMVEHRDNPAIADWVTAQHLSGLWVLSPDSEDAAPLEATLATVGLQRVSRDFYPGYPNTWLYHYRR